MFVRCRRLVWSCRGSPTWPQEAAVFWLRWVQLGTPYRAHLSLHATHDSNIVEAWIGSWRFGRPWAATLPGPDPSLDDIRGMGGPAALVSLKRCADMCFPIKTVSRESEAVIASDGVKKRDMKYSEEKQAAWSACIDV